MWMKKINFSLPFPVSVNALYNGGSGQKRFPSKKYKAWLVACPRLPNLQLSNISIHYRFFFPDNRMRDMENNVKCVSDYLVKCGVIVDDCWQIVNEMHLTHGGIDKKNPRVEIDIMES